MLIGKGYLFDSTMSRVEAYSRVGAYSSEALTQRIMVNPYL